MYLQGSGPEFMFKCTYSVVDRKLGALVEEKNGCRGRSARNGETSSSYETRGRASPGLAAKFRELRKLKLRAGRRRR